MRFMADAIDYNDKIQLWSHEVDVCKLPHSSIPSRLNDYLLTVRIVQLGRLYDMSMLGTFPHQTRVHCFRSWMYLSYESRNIFITHPNHLNYSNSSEPNSSTIIEEQIKNCLVYERKISYIYNHLFTILAIFKSLYFRVTMSRSVYESH